MPYLLREFLKSTLCTLSLQSGLRIRLGWCNLFVDARKLDYEWVVFRSKIKRFICVCHIPRNGKKPELGWQ